MRMMILTGLITFVIDQVTKYLVLYELNLLAVRRIDVFPPFLTFRMAWNEGVNFGILATGSDTMRWILVGVSLAICAAVAVWTYRRAAAGHADRWFQLGAGLVVGGALGNVIDRIGYGAVADFLNMSCCGVRNPYVFNVADIAIFVGAGFLIFVSGDDKEKKGGGETPP